MAGLSPLLLVSVWGVSYSQCEEEPRKWLVSHHYCLLQLQSVLREIKKMAGVSPLLLVSVLGATVTVSVKRNKENG